jgi:hypothetical protein
MGSVPTKGSIFASSPSFILTLTPRNAETGRLSMTGKMAGAWSYVFIYSQKALSFTSTARIPSWHKDYARNKIYVRVLLIL